MHRREELRQCQRPMARQVELRAQLGIDFHRGQRAVGIPDADAAGVGHLREAVLQPAAFVHVDDGADIAGQLAVRVVARRAGVDHPPVAAVAAAQPEVDRIQFARSDRRQVVFGSAVGIVRMDAFHPAQAQVLVRRAARVVVPALAQVGAQAGRIGGPEHRRRQVDQRAEIRLALPQRHAGQLPLAAQLHLAAHARQQFVGGERLDEVIVGAGLQALDLRLLAGAGRQQDQGHVLDRFVRADLADQAETIEARHHHVAEHQVGRVAQDRRERRLAIGRRVHVVVVFEQRAYINAHVVVVVHYQQAGARPVRHRGTHGRHGGGIARLVRQPAQRFLDERGAHALRLRHVGQRHHVLGRQVRRAERNLDAELGALAHHAAHPDRAAMQPHQLLDQRQPDAGAFEAAALHALDAVEALEHFRQFRFGNAAARVAHRQLDAVFDLAQAHRHRAGQREFKGVRQQVEDDLFPHVVVDVDGLAQRFRLHVIGQAGLVHRRAEHAGQVGRQLRQVGRREARLHPARFDAGKVQQRIDQLQQPQRIAVGDVDAVALARAERLHLVGQRIFQRAENQRQRRAEFMRHVGEERRLGAVDGGQRGHAALFLLVRQHVADGGTERAAQQGEEIAVVVVQPAAGAGAGHDEAERPLLPGHHHRQHHRFGGHFVVRRAREGAEAPGQIGHRRGGAGCQRAGEIPAARRIRVDLRGRQRTVVRQAHAAAQLQRRAVLGQFVQQHERHVQRQRVAVRRHQRGQLLHGARLDDAFGQRAQARRAPAVQHLAGGFGDRVEHAAHLARLGADRRERERHERFLEVAVAVEEHALVVDVRAFASVGADHHRADHRQRGGPADLERLPHRLGMLGAADRAVGIVVDLHVVRPPRDQDREGRRQAQADGRAQALRPARHGAERRGRPVHRADQLSHLAAAGQPARVVRQCACLVLLHHADPVIYTLQLDSITRGWRPRNTVQNKIATVLIAGAQPRPSMHVESHS